MVVLSNPGEPQAVQDQHYDGKGGRELADVAWAFSAAVLERRVAPRMDAGRSATHDTLMKHLADDVFGCPLAEVLDRAVITNTVRCSTPQNFGKYPYETRIRIGTECAGRHLVDETVYWQPRFVVACGAPVRDLLGELRRQGTLACDFAETHHPSALGHYITERREQFRRLGERIRARDGACTA